MNNQKNKEPYNEKGQRHGYWTWHNHKDEIRFEGLYINNDRSGLWLWYNTFNKVCNKFYYI